MNNGGTWSTLSLARMPPCFRGHLCSSAPRLSDVAHHVMDDEAAWTPLPVQMASIGLTQLRYRRLLPVADLPVCFISFFLSSLPLQFFNLCLSNQHPKWSRRGGITAGTGTAAATPALSTALTACASPPRTRPSVASWSATWSTPAPSTISSSLPPTRVSSSTNALCERHRFSPDLLDFQLPCFPFSASSFLPLQSTRSPSCTPSLTTASAAPSTPASSASVTSRSAGSGSPRSGSGAPPRRRPPLKFASPFPRQRFETRMMVSFSFLASCRPLPRHESAYHLVGARERGHHRRAQEPRVAFPPTASGEIFQQTNNNPGS